MFVLFIIIYCYYNIRLLQQELSLPPCYVSSYLLYFWFQSYNFVYTNILNKLLWMISSVYSNVKNVAIEVTNRSVCKLLHFFQIASWYIVVYLPVTCVAACTSHSEGRIRNAGVWYLKILSIYQSREPAFSGAALSPDTACGSVYKPHCNNKGVVLS